MTAVMGEATPTFFLGVFERWTGKTLRTLGIVPDGIRCQTSLAELGPRSAWIEGGGSRGSGSRLGSCRPYSPQPLPNRGALGCSSSGCGSCGQRTACPLVEAGLVGEQLGEPCGAHSRARPVTLHILAAWWAYRFVGPKQTLARRGAVESFEVQYQFSVLFHGRECRRKCLSRALNCLAVRSSGGCALSRRPTLQRTSA